MAVINESAYHSKFERLTAAVQKDIERDLYHGAVVEVRLNSETVYRKALGASDKTRERQARFDDKFLAMSISKAFTAVTVLQAIDRGDLQFDTRVCDVIPSFSVKGKQRANVRHLLTHTAGTFAGFQVPPPLDAIKDTGNLKKCVEIVSAMPAAYSPGSRVIYNPWASYAVLAEIVCRLDGKQRSFRDIVNAQIFEPLGMADSRYGLSIDDPRRVPVVVADTSATPPERAAMEGLNRIIDESCEIPAGGAFVTLDDAMRFIEMLRRGGELSGSRILSPALTAYALKNHTGELPNDFWDHEKEQLGIDQFPARFCLLGGYVRDTGHYLSPMGLTASPGSYAAVGGGSTMIMFDPARALSFGFFSSGFLNGLRHFQRLQRISDLVLSVID